MEFVTSTDHLTFQTLPQLLLECRLLQKVEKIAPTFKDIIQAVMKKSQCADQAVIEIRMTHTANEDSSGIYTLKDRRRRGGIPTKG